MQISKKTAIWWIRRDLRLFDNTALSLATQQADIVIPLYILDDQLLAHAAPKRHLFLFDALRNLSSDLQRIGSKLVIRQGNPVSELKTFFDETQTDVIIAEKDTSPYATTRDNAASALMPILFTQGSSVHPPEVVHKNDGTPYTVFTPFSRAWKALPRPGKPVPAPNTLQTPTNLNSLPLPETEVLQPFPASESAAQERLSEFLADTIFSYKNQRNNMNLNGTSRLSPYLRLGLLSARQTVFSVLELIETCEQEGFKEVDSLTTWLNELIWREFYIHILHHYPYVLKHAFRESLRDIRWRNSPSEFEAWKKGLTGYPVVDAAMRQLEQTGWMHNRARMITASFLTKDLLINWQEGEAWFMQMLVDGDPASNNGGWQWSAGTGTDAAPYFRIFNPVLQGKKFDPAGDYVRTWVPELSDVPNSFIHSPWEMPADLQSRLGINIGKQYPAPIVDHTLARERTLEAYKHSH